MSRPDVYTYGDPRSFLRDVLSFKQQKNPKFSARSWARVMGFRGHSLLGFFLSGARDIKPKHLENLLRGLDFDEKEKEYFQALVHFRSAKSFAEKEIYETWLRQASRDQSFSCLELEKFRVVSDWLHWAITEMTSLKDFQSDSRWIARRLGGKVSVYQVESAIDRLLMVGLLQRFDDGSLMKTYKRMTTPKDASNRAIREHHKAILKLASESLEKQDPSIRDFNSCVMTIDQKLIPKAKEMILKFRGEMEKLMEKTDGDETYELAIQFFKLTDGKGSKND